MAVETVFILGAGFSYYAGTPLQENFAEDVLRGRDFGDEQPSKIIVDSLEEFVDYVFHLGTDVSWPEWEDLFTCLDLSANSGHHLGWKYSPRLLRTIRRAILSRIIRMLEQRYKNALKDKVQRIKIQRLDKFLSAIDVRKAAFVSLNWDAVLELRLMEQLKDVYFDYGSHVRWAQFKQSPDLRITAIDDKPPGQRIVSPKCTGRLIGYIATIAAASSALLRIGPGALPCSSCEKRTGALSAQRQKRFRRVQYGSAILAVFCWVVGSRHLATGRPWTLRSC